MRLIVYGTLRKGEELNWVFSWASVQHLSKFETMEISGLRLYVVGDCPGAKIGSKGDKAIVELWEFSLSKTREASLLEMLDRMEGVDYGLYKRNYIDTPKGKALVYTYCGNVRGCPQIKDWKEWQNSNKNKKINIPNSKIVICK